MTVQEIIELTKAGWTKMEILQLAGASAPKDEPKETPKDDPKETPPKDEPKETPPDDAPKSISTDQKIMELITKLDQKVDNISSGIQKGNLQASRQPKQETVDDALASIINPFLNQEVNNNG